MNNRCIIILTLFILFLPINAHSKWETHYFIEGNFYLDMPQKPTIKVGKQKTGKGFIKTYLYQSCINECIIAYTASFADFGKDSHVAKNPQNALDFSKSVALKNVNGVLTYENYIDYKGYPGKEHKINIKTHQGLYVIIQRVYIINGKLYELNVSTPVQSQFMPEHYKFLNSFNIRLAK
jgi:hypothetical protein